MPKKVPPPRKGTGAKPGHIHNKSGERKGPFSVPMPKGPHYYYQVYCTCGKFMSNEDA